MSRCYEVLERLQLGEAMARKRRAAEKCRDLSCRSGQGDGGYWRIVSTCLHYAGPPYCLMTRRKGTLAQARVRWRLRTQRLAQAGDRASNTGYCQQAWDAGSVCGSDRWQRQKMTYSSCASFLLQSDRVSAGPPACGDASKEVEASKQTHLCNVSWGPEGRPYTPTERQGEVSTANASCRVDRRTPWQDRRADYPCGRGNSAISDA